MSIVVGYVNEVEMRIASDSLVNNGEMVWESGPKIWEANGVLYGAVGDLSAVSALRTVSWPELNEQLLLNSKAKLPPAQLWVQEFLIPKIKEIEIEGDWELVVCTSFGIVTLDSEFAISYHTSPYIAIGSGSHFSLGYLYEQELDEDVLHASIECAGFHSPSCGGATHMLYVAL